MSEDMAEKEFDYKMLEKLASIRCTLEEVAAWFDMPISTIRRMSANDQEFKRIWENALAKGKISLRRLQWRHATGFGPQAVQMAIHLSKHWLGEYDKAQLDINGTLRIEGSVNVADKILQGIKPELLTSAERIELSDLCDLVDDKGLVRLIDVERNRFFDLVGKASGENIVDIGVIEPIKALPAPQNEEK